MSEQEAPPESWEPVWSTCRTDGCIGIRIAEEDACLAHVGEAARRRYVFDLQPGHPVDLRGTTLSNNLLWEVLDATRIGGGVPMLGDALFTGARFSSRVGLDGALFVGRTSFQRAEFSGEAAFRGARFSGDTYFGGARFSGDTDFSRVWFCGDAEFTEARFSGTAGFIEARFSGRARFDKVRFAADARFDGAQFLGDAGFTGAWFFQAGVFGPLLAATELVLDRASFQGAMVIDVAASRLACVETAFPLGATVRARYAEIVLDGAVFAKPSTLVYAEGAFNRPADVPAGDSPGLDETPLRAGGRPPRPRLLSLRRLDVSTLALADVDLSACLFQGAFHIDSLRIEGARPFAATPDAWRVRVGRWWLPVWRRWSRRQALAEEHQWRAKQPTPAVPGRWARLAQPDWHGPACQTPKWVEEQTGQPVRQLAPGRAAVLYRSLRKAQEDSKDEPGAADFYYGEMEMRRKTPATPWPERFILWWYWLLAGYSLRGLRAVTALLVVVVGLGLLLQRIGFNGADPPLGDALIYTAQATLSLDARRALADQVSWAGDLLRIMLRLSGPVLLGLALLSVRNRVKR